MTDYSVEQKLRRAVKHATPDDFAGVLSRCGAQKGSVTGMIPPSKQAKRFRAAPYLAAACLALFLFSGGFWLHQATAVASIISLDVNPSLELKVNRSEKVLSAEALNEDGRVILEGMELNGTQATLAMNAIIGSLLQHGYVDELANSILITVEDKNARRAEQLQQELSAQADAALASAQVNGAILAVTLQHNDELNAKAAEYGISAGKAALIQAIVMNSGNAKTFEGLVGLTINELNILYSSQTIQALPSQENTEAIIGGADGPTDILVSSPIHTSGSASQSAYIGMDAAKAAALSHAGLSIGEATFLEAEYDYDNGRMVYEVEFHGRDRKYEYEIDAITAQVIRAETEDSGTPAGGDASSAFIGENAAKAAALNDAGVGESAATGLRVEQETEDGRPVYNVTFLSDATLYNYTVDGTSGAILEKDTEITGPAASGTDIGAEAAKRAAFAHAGVSAGSVYDLELERETDDGHLQYELEFKANGREYDYTVDGVSGEILKFESED